MPRNPNAVYKFDSQGRMVQEYPTVKQACKSENTTQYKLYNAMEHDLLINGHKFSFDEHAGLPFEPEDPTKEREPFDRNGFFDVDEFGQLYNSGKWSEESSIEPVKIKLR
ncbi:hypothetical protein AAHN97_15155 [Chitinophaga niabensis]|uniref:hypothetical protein n=1 Tax=Chitinophaga niabensis TaxID=536979 RepID=UPI0031BA9510